MIIQTEDVERIYTEPSSNTSEIDSHNESLLMSPASQVCGRNCTSCNPGHSVYLLPRSCSEALERFSVCHVLCSRNICRLSEAAMRIIERENSTAKFLWRFALLIQGDDPLSQGFDPTNLLAPWELRYLCDVVYQLLCFCTELMNRIGEIRFRLLGTHAQKKALVLKLIARRNCESSS